MTTRMRPPLRAAAPLAALSLLLACADTPDRAPLPLAATPQLGGGTRAGLPEEVAGFRRVALSQGPAGQAADYATPGHGAAAVVELGRPRAVGYDGDPRIELEAMVREQTGTEARQHGRSFEEQRRARLVAGAGVLDCAELSGRLGREPARQWVCAGWAGERMLRLRATELEGGQAADLAGFATSLARAVRGG